MFGDMAATENVGSKPALWKVGKFPGMEFCSSWSRLEKEQPEVFKLVQPLAGSEGHDSEYSYKVYKNQWGPSIVRRKLSLQDIPKVATSTNIEAERPPTRPSAFTTDIPVTTVPAVTSKKNRLEDVKSNQIHQSLLENISAWHDQTLAIREQTKAINDLVGAIWEVVQKGSKIY
jgi:hypothetical protein